MFRSRFSASLVTAALALVTLGIPTAAAGGSPTTRYVDVDGQASAAGCGASTAAFSTIQSAVSAANDGDTIVVCPGTYEEQVNVPAAKDDLLIKSRTPHTARILTPTTLTQRGLVRIAGDGIVLDQFKLVARATTSDCQKLDAMVEVVAGGSAVIRANRMYTAGGDSLGGCGYLFGVVTNATVNATAGGGQPNGTGAKSSVLWNVIKDFQAAGVITAGEGARSRVNDNSIQYLHGGPSPVTPTASSVRKSLLPAARRKADRLTSVMTDEARQRAIEGIRQMNRGDALAGKGPVLGAIGIVFVLGGYGVAHRNNIYSSGEAAPTGGPAGSGAFLLGGVFAGEFPIGTAADPVGPPGEVFASGNLIGFAFIAMASDDQLKVTFRENGTFFALIHVGFFGTQDSLVAQHEGLFGAFGMYVVADSSGNTIRNSSFSDDFVVDCYDETTGTGTGGTANTWSNVLGATANRPDICIPGEVVAP